jgi:hypothetical protein
MMETTTEHKLIGVAPINPKLRTVVEPGSGGQEISREYFGALRMSIAPFVIVRRDAIAPCIRKGSKEFRKLHCAGVFWFLVHCRSVQSLPNMSQAQGAKALDLYGVIVVPHFGQSLSTSQDHVSSHFVPQSAQRYFKSNAATQCGSFGN